MKNKNKAYPGKKEFMRACAILALKSHPLTSSWPYSKYLDLFGISKTTYFSDLAVACQIDEEIKSKKQGSKQ